MNKATGWQYRIVKELIEEPDEEIPEGRYSFTIRHVFYDDDGKPLECTEEIIPYGETRMELQEDLLKMVNALIHPAISMEDFDI